MNTSLENMVKTHVMNTLKTYTMNKNESLISEIHPEVNIRLNSVNVIVGKQSSGKTVIALKEIIKLGVLNTHHLFIYVTKDGQESDKTFLALKPLLMIPYIIISEQEAVEFMKDLISAKNLYNLIKRENLQDKIDDQQKEDMFKMLAVSDFNREVLHTIVLFDDISNSKLFSSEESYFSQLIRRCRHINFSFLLLIQGWKGLKPHVKNEISTLFIFPCFNKQQLRYIYSQSASNLSFDEFYEMYSKILKRKTEDCESHPYMIIQVVDGGNTSIELDDS
mgnify:FL=1